MSVAPSTDPRCYSPIRTPDWRWQVVLSHIRHKTCPGIWEDPAIIQAHRFLAPPEPAREDIGRRELRRHCPDLSAAHAIFTLAGVVKDELEARLLCQSPEEITGAMQIGAGVARTFATLFFDVLDSLHATDWLLFQAVALYGSLCPPTEAQCWRYLALAGGPVILDLVVSDYLGRPEPYYPDRHELAERARFLVWDHASLTQTGNPADPEIIEAYCRFYQHEARRRGKKLDPRVAWHLKFLRMAAKLPKSRELENALPKVRRRNAGPNHGGEDICRTAQAAGAGPDPIFQPAPAAETSEPATKGAASWITELDLLKNQIGDLKTPSPAVVGV
jgi:hypothetical protein